MRVSFDVELCLGAGWLSVSDRVRSMRTCKTCFLLSTVLGMGEERDAPWGVNGLPEKRGAGVGRQL